jgi:hypothetical protein
MPMRRTPTGGFVLQELLAIVLFVSAVLVVLAALSSRSRSLASLGESMANLKRLHQSTVTFGDDNSGLFATFTWRKGTNPSPYPDLVNSFSDLEAAANQAVDIMRRRAGLTQAQLPKITSWIPHVFYSHLVLSDHLGTDLPHRWVISPEDPKRLAFAFDRSQWPGTGSNLRWAFSSSYEVPVAFWSRPDSGPDAVFQSFSYNTFTVPNTAQFGQRRLDEVVYPSHKAMYHDRHQRHFGPRQGYFMHEEARVPVATVDGAVSVRRGADANQGWNPSQPTSQSPTMVSYSPPPSGQFAWDPPALSPNNEDIVPGRYRWTRRALGGRDVDGPQVP